MLKFVSFALTFAAIKAVYLPVPTCNNDTYVGIYEAINGVDYCSLPSRKINAACVAATCPDLTKESLCPIKSDGNIDLNNVEKTLQIINNCLKQSSICDVPLNPIKLPYFTVDISEFLRGTTLEGYCQVPPEGGVTLRNVSNTVVSVVNVTEQESGQQVVFSIDVENLTYYGHLVCKVWSDDLTKVFGRAAEFNLDNINYVLKLKIHTFSLEDFKFLDRKSHIEALVASVTPPKITGFKFGDFDLILNGVAKIVATFFGSFVQNSELPEAYAEFIETIVESAFEVAKQKC